MAWQLNDGVIANDSFSTPASAGTSQLVDGLNNQAFSTPASSTDQPVDAILGLNTWSAAGGVLAPTVFASFTYNGFVISPIVSQDATTPVVFGAYTYSAPVVTPVIRIDASVPVVSASITYLAPSVTPSISSDATAPVTFAGLVYSASVQTPKIDAFAPIIFANYSYSASTQLPDITSASGDATAPTVFAEFSYGGFTQSPNVSDEPQVIAHYTRNSGSIDDNFVVDYGTQKKTVKQKPVNTQKNVTVKPIYATVTWSAHVRKPVILQLIYSNNLIRSNTVQFAQLIRSEQHYLPLQRSA